MIAKFSEVGMELVTDELLTMKRRLDEIGEQVFLMAGPLLGAIRDKQLISYDKDIDLGVMSEKELDDICEKLGPLYDVSWTGTDIPSGKTLWLKKFIDEKVIVFEFQCHYVQKYVVFYNRLMEFTWKCYETHVEYPLQLFKNFTKVKLYGEEFLAPNPPEEWLDWFYGPDWRVPKEYSDWRYNCPVLLSGYMTEKP